MSLDVFHLPLRISSPFVRFQKVDLLPQWAALLSSGSGWIQSTGGTSRRQNRGRKVSSRCRFLQLPVCWVITGDLSQRPQVQTGCPLFHNSHSPQGLINPLSCLTWAEAPRCCMPQDVLPSLLFSLTLITWF